MIQKIFLKIKKNEKLKSRKIKVEIEIYKVFYLNF